VSECCKTPNEQISHQLDTRISWRGHIIFDEMMIVSALARQRDHLDFIVLAHWNNSEQ